MNATECLKPVTFNLGSESLRSLDLGDFYGVFAIYAGGEVNILWGRKGGIGVFLRRCTRSMMRVVPLI